MAAALPAPIKATGPHFYKYSAVTGERCEWLKDIILNHRIYVPNLTQLNDPADGRPKFAPKSEDELYALLYSSHSGVLGRNPKMPVEEQIKEGLILDVNLRRYGKDWAMQECIKLFYKEMDPWRVYSLSKRYNNLNLWANYAANHSGYCLEFANAGEFFSLAREVTYDDAVELDLANRKELDGHWFFCKRPEWRAEEEVRVLVPRNSDGRISFDPHCLTRIILGWKMPEPDRKLICEWAKQRSPELNVVSAFYDESSQVLRIAK
jgi:hypothetical protein